MAGDLLAELGYELVDPRAGAPGAGLAPGSVATARGRRLADTRDAVQRSPLWRRRHPHLG